MRLLCLALLFGGCTSAESTPSTVPVSVETIARGSIGGIRERREILARSPSEWRAVWAEHSVGRLPAPEEPEVDWSSHFVVGVTLGARPTGGYGVTIERIDTRDDRLIVRARENGPAPGFMTTQVVTYPFHFVRVTRTELPVEFELK